MANARTQFDALADMLLREHEAQRVTAFGKPGLALEGETFLVWHRDAIAARLSGRPLADALALDGAQAFDPVDPERARPEHPGWVRIPPAHASAWPRFAAEAMRCLRESRTRPVSWQVPPPAPPGPASAAPSKPEDLAARAKAALEGDTLKRLKAT